MPSVLIQSERNARAIPTGEPPEITTAKAVVQIRAGIQILEESETLTVDVIQAAQNQISAAQRKLLVMKLEMQNRVHGAALTYRELLRVDREFRI
jgi:hypothetical protein